MSAPLGRASTDSSELVVHDEQSLQGPVPFFSYVPLVMRLNVCQPIPGVTYDVASVNPPKCDRPAEEHADLNLALRGYTVTDAARGLVDYGGVADPKAPQLAGLFADNRPPDISSVYQVYDWDWGCNCRGALLTDPEVTLVDLASTPGETLHVPKSGYTIGGDYEVLVLYASSARITLKYTREDSVAQGFTLHLEKICVDPNLVFRYELWNGWGRGLLPALKEGQAFGYARSSEIGVAIRDGGRFLDPRSRKDWWQGQ